MVPRAPEGTPSGGRYIVRAVGDERVIGVDVGGTKILAGVIDRGGAVERSVVHPTPVAGQDAVLDALAGAVLELLDDRVLAVGFGIPSQIDQRTGRLGTSVNIPLSDVPFRSVMTARLGRPVAVDNDANVATFAEWSAGAGRGSQTMAMLTLGTGVGGGLVLSGRPYHGWAEVGHIVIKRDGLPCQGSCTGRGHLESYASGVAADRVAREYLGPDAGASDLVRARHPALREIGRYVGCGVATLVNLFDPEVVVIGGGFGVAAFDQLMPGIRETLQVEALQAAGEVPVVPAVLGAGAGLVGAALAAFDVLGS
jgi:glucokinase